jgi:heme exporter protein C
MAVLLFAALVYAPEDAVQGQAQRIFYIHVPSAWVSFLAFAVVFVASIGVLATGKAKWDELAAASAEVGVVFTTAVMISGPLWGKASWGVYWTWDPRLTSYFILWLVYLSYLALRSYVSEPSRKARFSAALGIVGFLDVPLVYFSVRWWRGLHPGYVIIAKGGPKMPGQMVVALMIGLAAFTLLYVYLVGLRLRVTRLKAAREAAILEEDDDE